MDSKKQNRLQFGSGWIAAYIVFLFLGVTACGYGYAASQSSVMISGEATVRAESDSFDVVYMQDMTGVACKAAKVGTSERLVDKRDNKAYWVRKMKDGNCWMVQNLAFNLSTSVTLTSELSDVTSFKPGYTTLTSAPTSSQIVTSATGTRSWAFEGYVAKTPSLGACSKNGSITPANCTQWLAVGERTPSDDPNFYINNGNKTYTDTEYDAHYLLGNYYQFNAATAGTGGNAAAANVTSSICPKGWKLPVHSTAATSDFVKLRKAEGVSLANLVLPPLYYLKSGQIRATTALYYKLGDVGRYWSASSSSKTEARQYMLNSDNVTAYDKNEAFQVRCIFYQWCLRIMMIIL